MDHKKILQHNRAAWKKLVESGNPWTIPVGPERIEAARQGEWSVVLTPTKPVPYDWFPEIKELKILGLASAGGQQGPIFAAAGAYVTIIDNSPAQLDQDRLVAEREGLDMELVQGDMADLSAFADFSFDLIFHPVSNVFAPNVRPVWQETFRVLKPGGILLAGITHPTNYLFDYELMDRTGELEVKYSIPYADIDHLTEEQRQAHLEEGHPLEFSHTLEDQIGGQLEAGFVLTGFYEDRVAEEDNDPVSKMMPTFIATRAVKPRSRRH